MDVHIGFMIRARAKELRIGPTELGGKINTSKQNVYGIYKRKSIDTGLLAKIAVALDFDFFAYYTRNLQVSASPASDAGSNSNAKASEHLKQEIDVLKKENEYLKRINTLLDDKLARLGDV